jgi:tetratricopeptide (TPR) repeat protein
MSRLPRWGGSMSEIVAEVEAARPYYMGNPALKVLEGRIDAEYGDEAFFSGRYARAIELYTQALQHGPQWYYYAQRSQAYTYIGQIELANQDLRRVLQLRPNRSKTLYDLGFNHYKSAFKLQDKKYLIEAVNYLSQALEDNTYDHKAFDIRGDAYFFLGKFELALADFEQALSLAPDNAEYREDVAKAKRALSSSIKPP